MIQKPFHILSSTENAKYKQVKGLISTARSRKKANKTVLEGIHLIQSYIQKGFVPQQIFVSVSAQHNEEVTALLNSCPPVHIYMLENTLYKQLRSVGEGIDIMAVIDMPIQELQKIHEDTLILNDLQDSGNVGTLLRTAAAIGIKNIVCTKKTASVWSPKALRAGMGAQFSLCIYEGVSVEEVCEYVQVPLLATSSHTSNIIYQQDLTKPVAWVMGHEGQGVCNEIMEQSTGIALPQPNGEESLNVAVAGSLCMYEMLRQRNYS